MGDRYPIVRGSTKLLLPPRTLKDNLAEVLPRALARAGPNAFEAGPSAERVRQAVVAHRAPLTDRLRAGSTMRLARGRTSTADSRGRDLPWTTTAGCTS